MIKFIISEFVKYVPVKAVSNFEKFWTQTFDGCSSTVCSALCNKIFHESFKLVKY